MAFPDKFNRALKSSIAFILQLCIIIIAGLIAWFLSGTGVGSLLELRSIDLRFKLRGASISEPETLIIAVDEKTFHDLKFKYPFPPVLYADLIEKLNRAGANLIAFDFLYSEPSRECNPPDQDLILSSTLKKWGNVVWALQLESGEKVQFPIKTIKDSAVACGYINLPDEKDGRIRRIYPQKNGTSSFSSAIVKTYAGFIPEKWKREEPILINFRGGAGTYNSVSLSDIIFGRISPERIKGKICLVGATFLASHDLYATPFHNPSLPDTPGVEIHANIIGNMLRGDYLRVIHSYNTWVIIIILVLIIQFVIYLDFPWMAMLVWVLSSAGWFLWSMNRFFNNEVVVLFAPLMVLSATFWVGAFVAYLKERKKKRIIRDLFESYVDPSIISWLLKNPDAIKLDGERRSVTIMDTDIEGFTAITERMDPEALVRHLNIYFETLTKVAIAEGGMHDKFVGDALMIIFGFPRSDENHALKALMAAKQMLDSVDRLNREWVEQNLPPLKTRIGICTGDVILGNVGGTKRKAFTAMGDAANLASRLEGLNKRFGTHIIISEATAKLLPNTIPLRDFGEVEVRGYSKPIRVYNPGFDTPSSNRKE